MYYHEIFCNNVRTQAHKLARNACIHVFCMNMHLCLLQVCQNTDLYKNNVVYQYLMSFKTWSSVSNSTEALFLIPYAH